MDTTTQAVRTNRLAQATSLYLQQHAHNPVDWYEWGPEALALAREQGKPIFLSIGYSACHWCHVMAHESFEDPEIAAVMNKRFVNIKVDREDRPDIDQIYMQATLVLNQGQGGWPMSVWLTPELKPFFAGTYFPPTSRHGRPGFKELCQKIAEAWSEHKAEIVTQADRLADVVRVGLEARSKLDGEWAPEIVDRAADTLAGAFDAVSGGMAGGGSNKFPPSMAMDIMLRSASRRPAKEAQRKKLVTLVELTLERMAGGGIYDQIGGGIHRYSTDVEWHVPHFEKMLYDQALVSRIYLDASQLTGKAGYARIAQDIFEYVLTDLQSPEGGFYSTRDADSEGVEGKYYVWTRREVLEILGPEDGELFCAHYDIREDGNWNDPHDPGVPKNILRELRDAKCCAKLYKISENQCSLRLAPAREKLLAARAKRVPPGLDDKVLVEWNGLMIASLARGGAVLGERKYVDAAARAARFVLSKQFQDGRLRRSYRAGRTSDAAFLSDYACLIEGLIELYEATLDKRWLDDAVTLNRVVIEHHWDEDGGGFFFTADDHEQLIARTKDVRDGAVPSGNSVQLMNLLRLSAILGDDRLRALADKTMDAFAERVENSPWSSERFLAAVDHALAGPVEVVIVGDRSKPETRALLDEVHRAYIPNRVIVFGDPAQPDGNIRSPLLANRGLVDDKPTVYVCRKSVCQQPVTTPRELAVQLAE